MPQNESQNSRTTNAPDTTVRVGLRALTTPVCGLRLLSDDRGRGSMSSSEMAVAQIAHSDGALVIGAASSSLGLGPPERVFWLWPNMASTSESTLSVLLLYFFGFFQTEGAVRNAKFSATF